MEEQEEQIFKIRLFKQLERQEDLLNEITSLLEKNLEITDYKTQNLIQTSIKQHYDHLCCQVRVIDVHI